jgi:hypothetical protein
MGQVIVQVEIMRQRNECTIHQLVASNTLTKAKCSPYTAPSVLSFGMLEHQGLCEIDFYSRLEVKTWWLFWLAHPRVQVLN